LRAPRQSDAVHFFEAYTQDSKVARYMTWRPHTTLAATEAFIAHCMDGWASGRSRSYALALHDSEDIPIGMLDARLLPNAVDIGYVLARKYWGTELMPEAIREFTEVALALPDCYRVQATCDVENLASARTLEKCGFVREVQLERHAIIPSLSAEPRPSFMYARWK
jgi:[ribosomal protein S5]-alanine N-acetyltransferase